MGDEDVVQEEVLPLEPLITQVTGVPPTLPLVRHTKVRPPAVSLHYLTHLATLIRRRPVHLDPEYFLKSLVVRAHKSILNEGSK